ncbi:MAG TPA: Ni/Fe hydrogenase subunit alpha [Pirellulales bacterium]|nr:Ni/Fe hydrogenase subunit alpha [Pirellulales bacterium]
MSDHSDQGNVRTIRVEALSRVEGEGGLHVRLRGNDVEDVQLTIFEPPRLFEALLRGRSPEDVPDIVARICGICPVAYQMSAVHALEAALGVQITPEIRKFRRLLYCGEWIESHALHVHLLHAPDFLGYESGLAMARDWPDEVNRGLRLKKHGNQLLEMLGGRAIHPINVAVGGFYKAPRREELCSLIADFEWGVQAAREITQWVAGFDFPQFERPYTMVALTHPDEYAMNEGVVASNSGEAIEVVDYEQHYEERQVAHSTALHSVRTADGSPYFLGPLARVNLNRERLMPSARRLTEDVGIRWPSMNSFHSIVARGIELVHAYEEALEILKTYKPPRPSRISYEPRAGVGCAATEAPRGLLYHRYVLDDESFLTEAKIVPPTSQNQGQIEDDLRHWLPRILDLDQEGMTRSCEHLVRNYDPCISCSTHFLRLTIDR